MSAFLCSENHLRALVSFALDNDVPCDALAFATLVEENMRSLRARYEDNREEEAAAAAYTFQHVKVADVLRGTAKEQARLTRLTGRTVATAVIKLCDCFDYQACETRDYFTSEAAGLVDSIRRRAQALGGRMTGDMYARLPWCL